MDMVCKKPYMIGTLPTRCGQCLPCRVLRGRQWTWRQYLESLTHEHNCFVTLTYSRFHIRGDWALDPRHLQLFLKRLRKAVYPTTFRFFAVGEYGERDCRPHYHLSLFGLSGYQRINDILVADHIEKSWGLGYTYVAEFNEATAQYTCGYVVKKLKDPDYGRGWNYPEFARMSNRPGLGAKAMSVMAAGLDRQYQDWGEGDVPRTIRVGKRTIGLGRYLLAQFRQSSNFTPEYIAELKQDASFQASLEMLAMYENEKGVLSFSEAHAKRIAQRLLQTEARYKIWQSKHPYKRNIG